MFVICISAPSAARSLGVPSPGGALLVPFSGLGGSGRGLRSRNEYDEPVTELCGPCSQQLLILGGCRPPDLPPYLGGLPPSVRGPPPSHRPLYSGQLRPPDHPKKDPGDGLKPQQRGARPAPPVAEPGPQPCNEVCCGCGDRRWTPKSGDPSAARDIPKVPTQAAISIFVMEVVVSIVCQTLPQSFYCRGGMANDELQYRIRSP